MKLALDVEMFAFSGKTFENSPKVVFKYEFEGVGEKVLLTAFRRKIQVSQSVNNTQTLTNNDSNCAIVSQTIIETEAK